MKRLVVLLGIAVLVAALGWALDSAAVPLPRQLASPERGPEPGMMALGALGLLAIGAALRRRS